MPPSVSIFFSSFLADSDPKKGMSDWEMDAEAAKIRAWRGVVVVRHFVAFRDESDAPAGYNALDHRRCWCSFTVTRQQSLAAMQAVARKS